MDREAAAGGGSAEARPEWPALLGRVEAVVASRAGRHPGIITEAIVEDLVASYGLAPRETHHVERRKNHPERIRRLAHEAFRALGAEPGDARAPAGIAAGVLRAFVLEPREAGSPALGAGG